MDQIKRVRLLVDHTKLQHVIGNRILLARAASERRGTYRDKPCRRSGVTRREERYLVSPTNELLGEVKNDSLGPTVPEWWHALVQGRQHRDSHVRPSCSTRGSSGNWAALQEARVPSGELTATFKPDLVRGRWWRWSWSPSES